MVVYGRLTTLVGRVRNAQPGETVQITERKVQPIGGAQPAAVASVKRWVSIRPVFFQRTTPGVRPDRGLARCLPHAGARQDPSRNAAAPGRPRLQRRLQQLRPRLTT
jgi:hypothetical protein